jgi:hypothetical protein
MALSTGQKVGIAAGVLGALGGLAAALAKGGRKPPARAGVGRAGLGGRASTPAPNIIGARLPSGCGCGR